MNKEDTPIFSRCRECLTTLKKETSKNNPFLGYLSSNLQLRYVTLFLHITQEVTTHNNDTVTQNA